MKFINIITGGLFLFFNNINSKLICNYDDKYLTSHIDSWNHWKDKYDKNYNSCSEDKSRFDIFIHNSNKINKHQNNDERSYNMKINHLADLDEDDFKNKYLNKMTDNYTNKLRKQTTKNKCNIDWRDKNIITPVKNQLQCGSCWAFSTIGAVEGLYNLNIKHNDLFNFSEQELVDCSKSYGNDGCNGGMMTNGFEYIMNRGALLEKDYEYLGVDGKCKLNGGPYKINNFIEVKSGNTDDLCNSLLKQPISVAVDASNWQFYSDGVFNDCKDNLDHGVLLVGSNENYWTIKNSWSDQWGENGYIRLKYGNTCGLANMASYPILNNLFIE